MGRGRAGHTRQARGEAGGAAAGRRRRVRGGQGPQPTNQAPCLHAQFPPNQPANHSLQRAHRARLQHRLHGQAGRRRLGILDKHNALGGDEVRLAVLHACKPRHLRLRRPGVGEGRSNRAALRACGARRGGRRPRSRRGCGGAAAAHPPPAAPHLNQRAVGALGHHHEQPGPGRRVVGVGGVVLLGRLARVQRRQGPGAANGGRSARQGAWQAQGWAHSTPVAGMRAWPAHPRARRWPPFVAAIG